MFKKEKWLQFGNKKEGYILKKVEAMGEIYWRREAPYPDCEDKDQYPMIIFGDMYSDDSAHASCDKYDYERFINMWPTLVRSENEVVLFETMPK